MNAEIVPNAKSCQLGEGPHWSSTEGVLYYVDIPRGRVLRYDPLNGGSCNFVDIDGGKDPVRFVIPSIKEKEFLIGKGSELCRLQWDFKQNDEPKWVKMVEVDVEWLLNSGTIDSTMENAILWDGYGQVLWVKHYCLQMTSNVIKDQCISFVKTPMT